MADENNNQESSNKITEKLVSEDTNPTKYTDPKSDNDKNVEIELDDTKDENEDNSTDKVINQPPKDEFYTAKAHRARRIYHVIIFSIAPIIYLWTAQAIADGIGNGISVSKIMSFLMIFSIILEIVRLKKKFIFFGMREYERDHICAQAWGTVCSLIVLLLAFPRTYSIAPVISSDANGKSKGSEAFACFGQIAIPIIWTLGIGDPLLGELKKLVRTDKMKAWQMYLIANCVLTVIWILCILWCGTPWWLAIIIPPIAIIAEKPSIPHIDDNGLMLLIPLLVTLIFEPWFPTKCNQIFYK